MACALVGVLMAAPPPVPAWLVPWSVWVIGGKVGPRPAGAPRIVPSWAIWFPAWVKWRCLNGRQGVRPEKAPSPVPRWVWDPATEVVQRVRRERSLAFWRRMGVWITRLDHFVPEWVATYGGGHYDYVIVPALWGAGADNGPGQDELVGWVVRAKAQGVQVVGSQWGLAEDPAVEAASAATAVRAYDLDGWCINGEKAYEGGGKSAAYAREFRARLPYVPLLWSPEPRLNLDHSVLQDLGVAYGPQAYPLENGWSVADVTVWARNFGYEEENTIPLVQAYTSPFGTRYPAEEYRDQARAEGLPAVIMYTGNQCLDDADYWIDLLV